MNQILNNIIETGYFIVPRLLKVAFFVLLFLGMAVATMDFTLEWGKPLYFSWSSTSLLAGYAVCWPFTVAPLWWKISFFTTGFLLLLPRVLLPGDP